jgi:hypothetical protein
MDHLPVRVALICEVVQCIYNYYQSGLRL